MTHLKKPFYYSEDILEYQIAHRPKDDKNNKEKQSYLPENDQYDFYQQIQQLHNFLKP